MGHGRQEDGSGVGAGQWLDLSAERKVLRPGQYGRVRAITSTKTAALLVPQRAVTELQGAYRVAVVGADNKVRIRPVKVGDRTGSMCVIEDGLKPGERVVAEGTQKVRPDAVVN